MSYWFLPQPLSDEERKAALDDHELQLAALGLADLGRAQGPDQIADWLRRLYPQMAPEETARQTEHFWRLSHQLMVDDTVVVETAQGSYMVGEITGVYRRESRTQGMAHILPVEWHYTEVSPESVPKLRIYAGRQDIVEITDEEALQSLKPYIPMLRKGYGAFFRWLGIIILLFELVYFWPKT